MPKSYVLAIDQGTTGTRVFCMDQRGEQIALKYKEHKQIYPQPGWVEHNAMEIWANVKQLIGEAIAESGLRGHDCQAIGITNQRETIVAWNKDTGEAVHNAIVWQCRRSSPMIRDMQNAGLQGIFQQKTGLLLDPYFSGSKIAWLLDNKPEIKALAAQGKLLIGTIETWLIWKLTNGQVHKSDFTNASRTLLFDIENKKWDSELLSHFGIPEHILPEAVPSCHSFGGCQDIDGLPDQTPIWGAAGDQQSALFGQACVEPGMAKNTYGTGCFLLANTGDKRISSQKGILTTLGCNAQGQPAYVLEGAIFIAGAAVQWLRDGLQIISQADETEDMARQVATDEVILVPAFVGLGAPHWSMDARGAIFGLTQDSGRKQLAKAALHSIALQSYDLMDIMQQEANLSLKGLRVDGGACANAYLMQLQADIIDKPVLLPKNLETTALGAALLAGIGVNFYDSSNLGQYNPQQKEYQPKMAASDRQKTVNRWRRAVQATIQFSQG